ncbi:hypothetical protein JCM33374_g4783 [Metschnikowia sp. JCM 33374]|nr:hypothetical protein JCM33374_g4783 [Metschnikowia sp. JCM 33374]
MVRFDKKQTSAYWPRGPGSSLSMRDSLEIVYLKYFPEKTASEGCTTVNFIFAHGTGMNKSVWKSHIEEIYRKSRGATDWKVGCILSVDAVGHGDSGILNKGKISWGNDWRDGAKDLITVIKHEINTTGDFLPSPYTRNILVGHSMGAFHTTYASFLEPELFDACVAIEPVIYLDEGAGSYFFARMKKISQILKDEFSSREEVNTFFRRDSFYKVMNGKVLEDFVDDEIYFQDGTYKTKSTKHVQLATYLSALYSLKFGQDILGLLEVPYLFITGTRADWNSPKSENHIKTSVPSHLLERAQIDGDHLVHASNVKDTVDAIYGFADRRARFIRNHRSDFPDVRFKNEDAGLKVKYMSQYLWKGDVDSAFMWDRPKSKL